MIQQEKRAIFKKIEHGIEDKSNNDYSLERHVARIGNLDIKKVEVNTSLNGIVLKIYDIIYFLLNIYNFFFANRFVI